MHLPVTVKEIQAGYLISPYFKDLYLYLAQNKLPSSKTAIHKVEMTTPGDQLGNWQLATMCHCCLHYNEL